MTLQSSGAISLDNIQTEFGGSYPIGIDEYYGRGGVQSSGTISIGDFYGRSAGASLVLTSSANFTVSGAGTAGNPYVATSTNKTASSIGYAQFTLQGGASTVTLNWSVSSEANYDFIRIYRNYVNSSSAAIVTSSGQNSGSNPTAFQSGDTIRVEYSKDTSVDSFLDQASLSLFIGGTVAAPAFIPFLNADRPPVYGSGAGPVPAPSGWTGLQNGSVDDSFVTVPTPFTFYYNGTSYNSLFVGSNTYITFGSGSNVYSSLSAATPGLDKIMLGASDNSYQLVSYIANSSYVRVRYEGSASTSGAVGVPNIVYEFTIWNPSLRSNRTVMEVLVGQHNRNQGVYGLFSSSSSIATLPTALIAANTSYIFEANNSTATFFTGYNNVCSNSQY